MMAAGTRELDRQVPRVTSTLVEMGFPKTARNLQMFASEGNKQEMEVIMRPFLRKSKPYFNMPTFFGMSINVRQMSTKSSYHWHDDTIVSIASKYTTNTGEEKRGWVPVLKVLFEAQYNGRGCRRQEMLERLDFFAPSLVVRALDVLRAERGILTRLAGGKRITREELIAIFQRYASIEASGREAPIERETISTDLYAFLKWKPKLRMLVSFAKREMARVTFTGESVFMTPVNESPNPRRYSGLHDRNSPRFWVERNGECYIEETKQSRKVDCLEMVRYLHNALENMWQNTLPRLNPTLHSIRPRQPYDEKRDELLLQRNRRA